MQKDNFFLAFSPFLLYSIYYITYSPNFPLGKMKKGKNNLTPSYIVLPLWVRGGRKEKGGRKKGGREEGGKGRGGRGERGNERGLFCG